MLWEWPGTLSIGSVNDLWIRIFLTTITLLFLLFTYMTQDFLPKQRIIQDLSSQDNDLRQQATEALHQMEPEDLADINPKAKQEMIETLRQMESESIPTLIQLLGDHEHFVPRNAIRVLVGMGREAKQLIPDLIQA